MKYKMLAAILALTVMSWAQTTTQTTPSAPQQSTASADKDKCPCCDEKAMAKEEKSCCHHEMVGMDKKAMSCCMGEKASSCCGKEGSSCMKEDKAKTAAATCGDQCGKDHEKGCCASHKKDEKAAMNCCGKTCGDHCASHTASGASK